jgi:hypothetical protein
MLEAYIHSQGVFAIGAMTTVFFFTIISYRNIRERFLVAALFVIYLVFYYKNTLPAIREKDAMLARFSVEESDITSTKFSVANGLDLTKPDGFKYIHLHQDLIRCVNELAFIKTFDDYAYEKLVVLLEQFCKVHYQVLVETLDCVAHYPILSDLRKAIMNLMYEFYFNVPQFSNNVKGNIYELIETNTRVVQSSTYRCMRSCARLCKSKGKADTPYKAPHAMDPRAPLGSLF